MKEYWNQVAVYADLAAQIAATDRDKLLQLIDKLSDLPLDAQARLLSHLSSEAMVNLPAGDRTRLWEELERLVTKHKKFADAQWAMTPDAVNRIEEFAVRLRPDTPELIHRRLFVQHDFELMDEKGDFERQRVKLDERRQAAVAEILTRSGIQRRPRICRLRLGALSSW